MDKFHSNNKVLLPLRGVAVLFAIIELGLTAYGVSIFDVTYTDGIYDYTSNVGSLNFMLFNVSRAPTPSNNYPVKLSWLLQHKSLWSLLLLIYLFVTLRFANFSHPIVTFVLLLVTSLFWFSGFIALAVFIGPNCYGNHLCQTISAAAAFGAFLWVIFLIDAIFAGMRAFGGHRSTGQNFGQPMQTA
ncbi:hypothetical protein MMC26_002944 [Xylographa opegraphella]|nr:hypothetical protein [Xylographa opegraphella]